MTVTIPPELEKFVLDEVAAGHYLSPEEVVTAGLARLMLDPPPEGELDDETLAAIEEAEAQFERGEGIPIEEAFARLRAKHFPPNDS